MSGADEASLTPALLAAMDAAFNANDTDAVMAFFAEDAVFDHALGPEPHGTRIEGREAIRAAFSGLFARMRSVRWEAIDAAIDGDTAICRYRRRATHPSGAVEECLSVDVLRFRGGLIVHKDTYFKQRTG